MARTIVEIKTGITAQFMNNETLSSLYGFTQGDGFFSHFSRVSLENILIDLVTFATWSMENLFDIHRQEVEVELTTLKPHTARWYRQKALDFQFGFELLEDSDLFDQQAYSEEEIENAKIIRYAAVTESEAESRLIVKIATETAGEFEPIDREELEAFTAYVAEIKDAGVRVTIINYLPDLLRLAARIVRDPLVLDSSGTHRINGGRPVEQALQEFVRELPFNGELRLQELANKLEAVDGVRMVQLDAAYSRWIDGGLDDYGDWELIDIRKIPVSGYYKLESFEGITYVV